MGNHQLYSLVYILLTWILTFVESRRMRNMPDFLLLKRTNYRISVVILMLFLIFLMGFRPPEVGTDTGAYMSKYVKMMNGQILVDDDTKDWLFLYFQYFCAQIMSVSVFFLLVAFMYVFFVYVACRRFSRNNAALMFLFALGAFSFFSYGVNGIRNGLATSFVVLALSYISGNIKEKLMCALLCIMAINCHGSAVIPVIAMCFSFFIKRSKFMFYLWGLAVLGSLVIGQSLSNIFLLFGIDERLAHYMTLENTAETEEALASVGFRWDFLLYSFMPILLGWYCIFKKRICDTNYHLLLGTYIYSNAVWVILIRIPFSNRFAYLSWFLYAIVLSYPLFKFSIWRNQGRKVAMIMMAHVTFTFLMYFYTGL